MSSNKRRRHTPDQIIRKLAEDINLAIDSKLLASGAELDEVCRHLETAEYTRHPGSPSVTTTRTVGGWRSLRIGARYYATAGASSWRRWSLVSARAARRERARMVLSAHPWNSGTSWRSVPAAM